MQELRILIVGAGVAGLTCAGLLARQGIGCLVVEREPESDFNRAGYILGLLPLGGRVLNALNLREPYFASSIEMGDYAIHDARGRCIKTYPLAFINREYGSYRGIERTRLVALLRQRGEESAAIRFGTTVTDLAERPGGVDVTFSDRQTERFDLVIGADGLHSGIRDLLLGDTEYAYRDTGWGGWMGWLDEPPEPTYREFWGPGMFLGLYPVAGRIGVFLGGPRTDAGGAGVERLRGAFAQRLAADPPIARRALDSVPADGGSFFWAMCDCRAKRWCRGRVVLLGDAAAAFLPTAGVGASMAMDSAAALADELSRADAAHLEYGLRLYLRRQRARVEKAQADSRKLGRLMFVQSRLLAGLRNRLLPYYSLQRMLAEISRVMEGR